MQRQKEKPTRNELYRRTVAALPCANCGIDGYSQAAHPPPTGKGIKESDLDCFPLCATRPGIPGCHQDFDQYRIAPKREARILAFLWRQQTKATIKANGDWKPEWD